MKKLISYLLLISLVFTVSSFGQIKRCEPVGGIYYDSELPTASRTDSVSWYKRFYFYVPEGTQTDTLQLLTYLKSTIGTPHVKLYYFFAATANKDNRNDTSYLLSPDSTALSTDYSTEGVTGHLVVGAAKDTLENGVTGIKIIPDAVVVAVTATTNNQSDTEVGLWLLGRVGSANNQ